MADDILPRPYWTFPSLRSIFDEDGDFGLMTNPQSGLAVSEDDKNIYIEASVPGIDPKDVDITFDKGTLWIKGESKKEEKEKKYYRRAASSFSYRVNVPGELDPNTEPEATYANGVMTVTFAKSPKTQPKKIAVKAGK